jgi:hypothetical protein
MISHKPRFLNIGADLMVVQKSLYGHQVYDIRKRWGHCCSQSKACSDYLIVPGNGYSFIILVITSTEQSIIVQLYYRLHFISRASVVQPTQFTGPRTSFICYNSIDESVVNYYFVHGTNSSRCIEQRWIANVTSYYNRHLTVKVGIA